MRSTPSVLHLDLDAFFASVEQRDKPSLRGRPVIVGGVGGRGVVATASYEARAYGARSAMATAEARRRCPAGTAFLSPRSAAYRGSSRLVMALLAEVSPLVEQVSIDEAYVDLAAAAEPDLTVEGVSALARSLRERIRTETGGLTASVGIGSSKLMAKIASELDKPDGLTVVPPGHELAVLHPLPVRRLGGVGPATAERLRRLGVETVGDLAAVAPDDLVSVLGQASGTGLHRMAHALDDRPVVPEREAKSVSAEETFGSDLTDPALLRAEVERLADRVGTRLKAASTYGRTVTLKVRRYDFSTLTRSITLAAVDRRPTAARAHRPHAAAGRRRHRRGAAARARGVGAVGPRAGGPVRRRRRGGEPHRAPPSGARSELETPRSRSVPAHQCPRPPLLPRPASAAVPTPAPPAVLSPLQPGWRPGQDVTHREHGARLGVGLRAGPGDRPVRGPGDAAGAGAHLRRGRPRPASPRDPPFHPAVADERRPEPSGGPARRAGSRTRVACTLLRDTPIDGAPPRGQCTGRDVPQGRDVPILLPPAGTGVRRHATPYVGLPAASRSPGPGSPAGSR